MTRLAGLVVAARTVGEHCGPVHLAALATPGPPPGAVATLCGAMLASGRIEIVEPGTGVPCTTCLIHQADTELPVTPPDGQAPGGPMAPARRATPPGYAALGWPVTVRGNQVLLAVGTELVALIMPTVLADQATVLLTAKARPAPILAHPQVPDQRIVLAAEPFGVRLRWPTQIRSVAGHLPLPPTRTPAGPVTWTHLPDGHALGFCREIDLFGVVYTLTRPVLNTEETLQ
ncbi:MAG: hypothetical protein ACRDTF_21385 [Pseudonocardiaceae bacterium]